MLVFRALGVGRREDRLRLAGGLRLERGRVLSRVVSPVVWWGGIEFRDPLRIRRG